MMKGNYRKELQKTGESFTIRADKCHIVAINNPPQGAMEFPMEDRPIVLEDAYKTHTLDQDKIISPG